jgi:hypothetical protein
MLAYSKAGTEKPEPMRFCDPELLNPFAPYDRRFQANHDSR